MGGTSVGGGIPSPISDYQELYKKIAAVATRDSNGQRKDHLSIRGLSDAVQALKQRVVALELKCGHCK